MRVGSALCVCVPGPNQACKAHRLSTGVAATGKVVAGAVVVGQSASGKVWGRNSSRCGGGCCVKVPPVQASIQKCSPWWCGRGGGGGVQPAAAVVHVRLPVRSSAQKQVLQPNLVGMCSSW